MPPCPAIVTKRPRSAIHPHERAVRRAAVAVKTPLLNTATCALPSARREVEMLRKSKGWISLSLALGLVAGGLPAQASEVVKLARLVVSGKRGPTDAARPLPSAARSATTSPQVHGSGGSNDSGTAPAPARGVS